MRLDQLLSRLDSTNPGHRQIHEHNLGHVLIGKFQRFFAVNSGPDHLEIGLVPEK